MRMNFAPRGATNRDDTAFNRRLSPPPARSLLSLALLGTAQAGDAAARKVIGFSPDGTHFAFEQYTQLYDATEIVAEIQVIDTRTDDFAKGTPFSLRTKDDDEREVDAVRAELMARAKPLLGRLGITEPGTRFAGQAVDGSRRDRHLSRWTRSRSPPRRPSLCPTAASCVLTISDQALGKASCYGAGGRGTYGSVIVTGMTLQLSIDGTAPITLQQDKQLPKRRRCVTAYGIADVYHHHAKDGTQTLAVLIETVDAARISRRAEPAVHGGDGEVAAEIAFLLWDRTCFRCYASIAILAIAPTARRPTQQLTSCLWIPGPRKSAPE